MRKLAVVFALALLPLATARAQPFCPGVAPWVFADVQASDSFCTYITWMATTGVTTGCQVIDANNRLYCPDDLVTRKQMSAFMSRLGRDVTFAEGGNAFGALPNNTAVLGTADGNALDVQVNNSRVMRYEPNAISPNVIGGHPTNYAAPGVRGATIGGGGVLPGGEPAYDFEGPNRVTAIYGTVGGGYNNQAGNTSGPVINGGMATVGGGFGNKAEGFASTIAGGDISEVLGHWGTVGGGINNRANGFNAPTVAGGAANYAMGIFSTVGGGRNNEALAEYATVPGGQLNHASGLYSFAAGRRAKTQSTDAVPVSHDGAFVWADSSDFDFNSSAANEFAARATGGVRLVLGVNATGAPTWTCSVASGGSWACSSDRNLKQNLRRLEGREVLARVASMPIYAWNPKGPNSHLLHYGPTAQDFHAAFGLGDSPLRISQQDADGVALAAIQGLNAKLEAKVAARDAEISTLKREMADLRLAVEVLMARTSTDGRVAQTR